MSQTGLEKQSVVWESPNNKTHAEVEGINWLPAKVNTLSAGAEVPISFIIHPGGRNRGQSREPAGNWLQSLPLFQHVLENLFSACFFLHVITSPVSMRRKHTEQFITQWPQLAKCASLGAGTQITDPFLETSLSSLLGKGKRQDAPSVTDLLRIVAEEH